MTVFRLSRFALLAALLPTSSFSAAEIIPDDEKDLVTMEKVLATSPPPDGFFFGGWWVWLWMCLVSAQLWGMASQQFRGRLEHCDRSLPDTQLSSDQLVFPSRRLVPLFRL